MRRKVLRALADLGVNHPSWVLGSAALLAAAVIALFFVWPPRIQSDVLDLLPGDDPVVQDFRTATKDFKSLDYLFVLLKSDDPAGHPAQSYEEFADLMAERLRRSPRVDGVEYRLQDYKGILDQLLPRALLYLSPEDVAGVADKFSDAGLRGQVATNREWLTNPASLLTKDLIRYDPFGLLPIFQKKFAGKATQLAVDASDGYYASKDASALLLIVRPKKPAQDLPFSRALMAEVRSVEAQVRTQMERDGGGAELSHLAVRYGGGYPIAQSDFRLILRDAALNTVSSLALVFFIYLWAFRRRRSLAYGWVPLLFGLLLTFGLVHLVGVTLNSATAGFGAILIGLGIDFPTVLYGRYLEERNRGVGAREAVISVMENAGSGVWVGAVTTAATFAAMLLTHFPGMRQVGLLTSCGIVLCAASVFFLLPAMLTASARRRGVESEGSASGMRAFGLDSLGELAHRHPVGTLVACGLATVGFLFAASGIRVDEDVQNLRSKSNEGIEVSMEVARTFGASFTYMMVLVDAPTPDGVVVQSEQVVESVRPFVDSGQVLFTDSLSTYLPPESRQREVMAALAAGSSGAFSPERIRSTFVDACRKEGFDPAFFGPTLDSLPTMLAPSSPLTFAELRASLAGPMVSKYLVEKSPGHYRGVVYLYLPEGDPRFEPDRLVRAVAAAVPRARVVGINLLSRFLRLLVQRDAALAFAVGTLLVLLIVVLDFRSLWAGFFSLVPLFVGVVWMLGSMRLLGQPLNMMNIFVTTMILGIGSDYGIHFVHRYREEDGGDMTLVIRDVGKPIAVAALTTIAGFGSMSLSSYPGLRSMGYVSLLGTLYCMVATLTVLVALLTLRDRRRARSRVGGDP